MSDAVPTGWKFYRIAYSHEREGWCVYIQTESELILHDGCWKTQNEAMDEMIRLNNEQGVPTNV